jgi:hypothetical protein
MLHAVILFLAVSAGAAAPSRSEHPEYARWMVDNFDWGVMSSTVRVLLRRGRPPSAPPPRRAGQHRLDATATRRPTHPPAASHLLCVVCRATPMSLFWLTFL